MAVTGAVALGGLAISAYGAYQASQAQAEAQKRANALANQPVPQYSASPQLQQYLQQAQTESANPQGYTGAQTGNFNQNIARQLNSRFATATATAGGQASRAINGLNVGDSINATNSFANNDANLLRQNRLSALNRVYQGIGMTQGLQDRNTATALQRRLLTEQALGGAINSNHAYQQQFYGQLGNDITGAAAYKWRGLGGTNGTNPTFTNSPYSDPTMASGLDGSNNYYGGTGSTYYNGDLGGYSSGRYAGARGYNSIRLR